MKKSRPRRPVRPLCHTAAVMLVVIATGSAISEASGRDPFKQPFDRYSIWNTPIGDRAWYVDAEIEDVYSFSIDEEIFLRTRSTDPARDIYRLGSWTDRSSGTVDTGFDLHLPNNFLVADAVQRPDGGWDTPNNSSAFLRPDGFTLIELNPFTRPDVGGRVYAFPPKEAGSIFGDGLGKGSHGGSYLSAIGGSIRKGELFGAGAIRHALKINLFGEKFLYYREDEPDGNPGFLWPATAADSYANTTRYAGTVPELQMGSLLAIPSWVNIDSLGLQSRPARKIARALQDFGGYVVDNTNWNSHAICIEDAAAIEFEQEMGFWMNVNWNDTGAEGEWYEDMMRIYRELWVVKDNRPTQIGGKGNRRVARPGKIYCRFKNKKSGKFLDVEGHSTGNGGNVHIWQNNGPQNNQKWEVRAAGATQKYHYLVSKHSGKYLDIDGGSAANGANVEQRNGSGGHSQQWEFVPAEGEGSTHVYIRARHSGKHITTEYSGTANGTNLHQWAPVGGNAQKWKIIFTN